MGMFLATILSLRLTAFVLDLNRLVSAAKACTNVQTSTNDPINKTFKSLLSFTSPNVVLDIVPCSNQAMTSSMDVRQSY